MEINSESLETKSSKIPGPVAAGLFFSLAAFLMVYGGVLLSIFKGSYLKSGMGELLFVLAPVMLFLLVGRYNIRETLKLQNTKASNYLIVVFLMIFGMPVAGLLNAVVLGIIRLVFGRNLPIPQFTIPDIPTLFIAILVIGLSAAVCEEVLFRGFISKGFQRYGAVTSLVITSVLFGILHRDIQRAVGTMLLGALIGFIVYRTDSIYAGMLAHFTNNTFAVLLTFMSQKINANLNRLGLEQSVEYDLSNLPNYTLIVTVIFGAFLVMGCLSFFITLFYAFCRNTRTKRNLVEPVDKQAQVMPFVASVLPGVLLILFVFTGQILELMGINSGLVYNILRLFAII